MAKQKSNGKSVDPSEQVPFVENESTEEQESPAESKPEQIMTTNQRVADLVTIYRRVLPDRFCQELEKILSESETPTSQA